MIIDLKIESGQKVRIMNFPDFLVPTPNPLHSSLFLLSRGFQVPSLRCACPSLLKALESSANTFALILTISSVREHGLVGNQLFVFLCVSVADDVLRAHDPGAHAVTTAECRDTADVSLGHQQRPVTPLMESPLHRRQ